jgi:glycolate oxidase FAD binding subunit
MNTQLSQWSQLISEAAAQGRPLRLRGGGTKDFYGQSFAGEVLDTRAYSGVISYEPSELVITVRAGTPLRDIEQLLAKHQQCLAFEPPHFDQPAPVGSSPLSATIGGMVAAGLSGPSRAAVGSVRDFILGARMLNGRGEDLTFGGQVMKNVAGYDVSRLLAGSMGQLGLMTEFSIKVLPVAQAEKTLKFDEVNQSSALHLLNTWGGQPLPLNASTWHESVLYVRLRGAAAAVASAVDKMSAQAKAQGVTHVEEISTNSLWTDVNEQRHSFFTNAPSDQSCLWRLSVPQTAPELSMEGVSSSTLIEWLGAQRWVWAPATSAAAIRAAVAKVSGHATLFRVSAQGGEPDRQVGVMTPLNEVQSRIQQSLKQQFDPAGIFNPARV